MRATAVLPIKRFGTAKSRLSHTLAPAERAALAEAMLSDVLAALSRAEQLERVIVVSGEQRAVAAAREAGVELIDDPADSGHSQAALLPGDCPLLAADELDAALTTLEPGTAAVVPDRHGSGTNGLLLAPPDAIEPAFGPGSRERHLARAGEAGVAGRIAEIPSLGLDLDTPDDLAALRRAVGADTGRAPATARALAEL